jgi:ATP-dependent Lon protease
MELKMNFLQQEEEMDFMPIIPLNESEGEGADESPVPSELPLLPLRNTVLFPGVVIPITVGRDKSIKAIAESYKSDKLVGVLSQKDSNVEDPGIADLVSIGTVAKIIKLIKMPDGGTTAILQGKKRFSLQKVTSEDPYFKGQITFLKE